MIENFIRKSHKNVKRNREIPNRLLVAVGVSYLIPLVQEFFLGDIADWLWFLYIIPITIFSYYKTFYRAIDILIVSGLVILVSEIYHLVLDHAGWDIGLAVAFGVIFSMTITLAIVNRLSENIEAARKSWEVISETTNMAIEMVDRKGHIVYVNKAFEKLKGVSRKDILQKHYWDTHCYSILGETLKTGQLFTDRDYVEVNNQGKEVYLLADTFILHGENDELIGALLTIYDITEKRLTEIKAQQSEKLKVLGQMAAGLAHEIRNPLTSIRGFLQLSYIKGQDKAEKDFIKIMLEEVDRVNKLISNFLVLAKQVPTRKELNSLKVLISDVVSLMTPKAALANIKIKVELAQTLPIIMIDQEQIKQVLINVIQNAIEAMPTGGKIDVKALVNGGQLIVTVNDTGEGMDKKEINKVLEPFYTTKDTGTGLGLPLCNRIIEDHGGSLELVSFKGVGTQVIITLPIIKVA